MLFKKNLPARGYSPSLRSPWLAALEKKELQELITRQEKALSLDQSEDKKNKEWAIDQLKDYRNNYLVSSKLDNTATPEKTATPKKDKNKNDDDVSDLIITAEDKTKKDNKSAANNKKQDTSPDPTPAPTPNPASAPSSTKKTEKPPVTEKVLKEDYYEKTVSDFDKKYNLHCGVDTDNVFAEDIFIKSKPLSSSPSTDVVKYDATNDKITLYSSKCIPADRVGLLVSMIVARYPDKSMTIKIGGGSKEADMALRHEIAADLVQKGYNNIDPSDLKPPVPAQSVTSTTGSAQAPASAAPKI